MILSSSSCSGMFNSSGQGSCVYFSMMGDVETFFSFMDFSEEENKNQHDGILYEDWIVVPLMVLSQLDLEGNHSKYLAVSSPAIYQGAEFLMNTSIESSLKYSTFFPFYLVNKTGSLVFKEENGFHQSLVVFTLDLSWLFRPKEYQLSFLIIKILRSDADVLYNVEFRSSDILFYQERIFSLEWTLQEEERDSLFQHICFLHEE